MTGRKTPSVKKHLPAPSRPRPVPFPARFARWFLQFFKRRREIHFSAGRAILDNTLLFFWSETCFYTHPSDVPGPPKRNSARQKSCFLTGQKHVHMYGSCVGHSPSARCSKRDAVRAISHFADSPAQSLSTQVRCATTSWNTMQCNTEHRQRVYCGKTQSSIPQSCN